MKLHMILLRATIYALNQGIYIYNLIRWEKPAKPGKIIYLDPRKINRSIEFTPIVKQRRYYLNGVVSKGVWGKTKYELEKLHSTLFKAFEKHFLEGIPFIETQYFKKMKLPEKQLNKKLNLYNNKYCSLYSDIKNGGFKINSSFFSRVDDFKISIGSNGDFLFMTGKHRLAIARLMGDDFKMPVKVSYRHSSWQKYRDNLYQDLMNGEVTKEEIRKIGHPDLMDLIEN